MTSPLAIVEIAGRDSVAAAVAAVRDRGFATLLPTIAFTGTESGDRQAPYRAVETLRTLLAEQAEVLEPVALTYPTLWSAMNATPADEIRSRFGVYSQCLACHLYLHLLRVPLAWEHGSAPIVSGERDSHDGRVKLSQTPDGIDSARRVLAYAGVELLEPVRHASGDDVAALVGGGWEQGHGQMGCVYSGNYVGPDGCVRYDESGYARYLTEFFEPLGCAIVDAWREEGTPPEILTAATTAADDVASQGDTPDYDALVRGVLAG